MWWIWLALAFAQEDPASVSEPPPDAEIIIYGDRIRKARRELHETLIGLGYTPKRTRNGRTTYVPPWKQRWKPRVIVDRDGWMQFRSPQFVFQGVDLGLQPDPIEDIPGSVTPTGIHVGVRFWITSGRKLAWQEHQLTETLEPRLRTLRAAIAAENHAERMKLLPDQLDAIWFDATQNPTQRRHALTESLLLCADTPEGQERRAAILVYLSEMVQTSDTPYPPEEWTRLNAP